LRCVRPQVTTKVTFDHRRIMCRDLGELNWNTTIIEIQERSRSKGGRAAQRVYVDKGTSVLLDFILSDRRCAGLAKIVGDSC